MTRWKKDAKEFTVRLYSSSNGGGVPPSRMCRVPRPLVEVLGNPKSLRFSISGNKVSVEGVSGGE